jgi:hypothetical protein
MPNLAGIAGKAFRWVLVSVRWVVVGAVTIVLLSLSAFPALGVIGLVVYRLFGWFGVIIVVAILLYVLVLIYPKARWRARRSGGPRSAINLSRTDREILGSDAAGLTLPQVIALCVLWIGGGSLLVYFGGSPFLLQIVVLLILGLYPLVAFSSIFWRR